ncbi:hypothetical protein BBP00_00002326 [Phytophthora kernoviae]|uniref:Uncharacterized protein n=1 Tax=Phytophthora kernoviae TaxID=325452 RepID=A0A3F2RXP0_9STRA|nr:hypothetical protein BBP00_00002326 [Phytophthora kernoviae]
METSRARVQQQLTTNWSSLRYRMEHYGYRSNHLLHGVVALLELGASHDKIEDFAESYAAKLDKQEPNHEDVTEPETRSKLLKKEKLTYESACALFGKRQNFDGLLALYSAEVQELGVDRAVKKHLPFLVGGLAGALFHSIIQLGYAYRIGGDRLVAEGLAYLHYSYLSFDEPQVGLGEDFSGRKKFSRTEALTLLKTLNGNQLLLKEMYDQLETASRAEEKPVGMIQKRLSTMSGDPERGSPVAFQMIWDTINSYDLSKMDGVFALDLAFWLYLMIEHNDFVILHAVTSAWALQQVEHLLEPEDRTRAWKVWLHVALSAFVTSDIDDVLESDVCDQPFDELTSLEPWRQIVAKTLTQVDGGLLERDLVHAYKLVQVARDHGAGNEEGFLSTEERDLITRKSALKVISVDRLAGQVAVITGAAGGIGRKSAILFAKQGARGVVCADVNEAAAAETAQLVQEELKKLGKTDTVALAVKADVSKASDVENMVKTAEKEFGGLNVLFNNAGIMHSADDDAIATQEDVWDLTMNINVKGVFLGCKYGIPAIRRAGGGSIINTASFVGILGAATPQLAYTSSKGAVIAMSRELATIHARENIRVNALCPGPLNTELLQKFLDTEEKKQRRLVHVPMGRFGEAAEMAKAALFLASDDASYITGTSFVVDGGITSAYVTSEGQVDPFGGPSEV